MLFDWVELEKKKKRTNLKIIFNKIKWASEI